MARTNNLANFLTDVASAIKTKKGDNTPIYANTFDTEIANLPSGGGNVVNGIIEQYLAENETIDANTFVEFVNHYQDTTLISAQGNADDTSAVKIDTNKVFIAHASDNTNKYLNGVVCTISNNTINVGTDTTLISTTNASYTTRTVLIDTNKVFIAHRGSNGYLNGIVCTISGTTITTGTDTTLVSTSDAYNYSEVVLIDTNKVFITHANNYSNKYLNGIVCTISGTTITKGTDTNLVAISNAVNFSSLALIDTNKVFITNAGDTNAKLYGIICTISGTTITKGTNTNLSSEAGSVSYSEVVLIDTNKVFIAHRSGTTNDYLNGIVCTISGTTITTGTDTTLVSKSVTYSDASLVLINTNKVFIAHHRSNYLYGIICTISGTTITTGTDTALVSTAGAYNYSKAVLIDTNKVFIAHASDNTNKYLNGIIVYIDNMDILAVPESRTVKPSVNKIQGLTKTSGTNSSPADVWVLDNE